MVFNVVFSNTISFENESFGLEIEKIWKLKKLDIGKKKNDTWRYSNDMYYI